MSDNGRAHFYADKPNRNAAFSYRNDVNLDREVAGDQSARVDPFPAYLAPGQKVSNGDVEPAPESPAARSAGRVIPNTNTPVTSYGRG